ncbi:MAG: hypothetical protein ACYC1U_02110 [Candidatus Aquicultorales bacterium]
MLSAGIFRELSEQDLRILIESLSSRDARAVFGWTFQLATARLFSKRNVDDPFDRFWRKMIAIGVVLGAYVAVMAVVFAASFARVFGRNIELSPFITAALWLPFAYLGLRFLWDRINAMLIKTAAVQWNKPVKLEKTVFLPMSIPTSYPNLNNMRYGLLTAEKLTPLHGKVIYDSQDKAALVWLV